MNESNGIAKQEYIYIYIYSKWLNKSHNSVDMFLKEVSYANMLIWCSIIIGAQVLIMALIIFNLEAVFGA